MPAPRLSSPSVHPAVVRRFHSTMSEGGFIGGGGHLRSLDPPPQINFSPAQGVASAPPPPPISSRSRRRRSHSPVLCPWMRPPRRGGGHAAVPCLQPARLCVCASTPPAPARQPGSPQWGPQWGPLPRLAAAACLALAACLLPGLTPPAPTALALRAVPFVARPPAVGAGRGGKATWACRTLVCSGGGPDATSDAPAADARMPPPTPAFFAGGGRPPGRTVRAPPPPPPPPEGLGAEEVVRETVDRLLQRGGVFGHADDRGSSVTVALEELAQRQWPMGRLHRQQAQELELQVPAGVAGAGCRVRLGSWGAWQGGGGGGGQGCIRRGGISKAVPEAV